MPGETLIAAPAFAVVGASGAESALLHWLDPVVRFAAGHLLSVMVVSMAVYVGRQIWAIRRWQGWFAKLAWLPVVGCAMWLVVFVVEVARDPTSHNLMPFELLIGMLAAGIYLVLLTVIRAGLAIVRSTLKNRNVRSAVL